MHRGEAPDNGEVICQSMIMCP